MIIGDFQLAARQSSARHRLLMSIDAVGGVWRYGLDLAAALQPLGIDTVLLGFGPPPSAAQEEDARRVARLIWSEAPLDWLVEDAAALAPVHGVIERATVEHDIDLVQLNLPSQAAGLVLDLPLVVVSHSCVVSWFRAVRGTDLPAGWEWQERLNREGFAAADIVVAPSASHAELLGACYGALDEISVVPNATSFHPTSVAKHPFVFAAGRWWDDGKNGATLDAAAALTDWPVRLAGAIEGPNGQAFTPNHAEWLGELPNRQVRNLAGMAGIFVSPSVYEPFGLSALEAAAGGAAMVLADIPTYRELWDGAACLVPPRDATGLAIAINRLAADAGQRAELGAAARQRAAAFTPALQAARMHRLYIHALRSQTHRERGAR